MNEVIPPATAALDSVKIFALCVKPGSLKCTWSSIHPGKTNFPFKSMILQLPVESIEEAIFSILPFLIRISATICWPSFTIVHDFSSVVLLIDPCYAFSKRRKMLL